MVELVRLAKMAGVMHGAFQQIQVKGKSTERINNTCYSCIINSTSAFLSIRVVFVQASNECNMYVS